jgi:membrane-associated protein
VSVLATAPTVVALGPDWLNPTHILEQFGGVALLVTCLIIFAECGLLIGFFLPGDSLLFTLGLFVAQGSIHYPLWLVCLLISVCAVAGNLVGYWVGYKAGPAIFHRPDSRWFKQENVERTHAFFERYGPRAVILARFVPIVRTFITVMAGVGRMDFRKYAIYSTIGGVLWGTGVTLLGYWLGDIEFVKNNIELILVAIVLVSVIPIGVELIRARSQSKNSPSKNPASSSS